MIHLSFQDLARLFQVPVTDPGGIVGVSTDTRSLQAGNLFVALKGENFDGHDFCEVAVQKGAAALVVDRPVSASVPVFVVKDTLVALGELAKLWKSKLPVKTIGLTGSHGKTTLKNMLRSIMQAAFGKEAVLASVGNFNNRIGLPLNLFQLNEKHRVAVLEMGMSELGEIHFLSEIAEPDVAIVHNIGYSHIGKLNNDLSSVFEAKSEIFVGLKPAGIAVINGDDKFLKDLRRAAGQHEVITYGFQAATDFAAKNIKIFATETHFTCQDQRIVITHPGLHQVMNALAAIAASRALNIAWPAIIQGLRNFEPEKQRQEFKRGLAGATLIDDTYNASLHSSKAALDVLSTRPGRRLFVFGDMRELGDFSLELHAELGHYARSLGVERVFTVGKDSEATAQAFGAGAEFYPSKTALIEAVKPLLNPETTVLIKGSRGMKMEEVVHALQEKEGLSRHSAQHDGG